MCTNQEKDEEAYIRTNMVDYNNKHQTRNNNDIDSKSLVVTQNRILESESLHHHPISFITLQCFGSLIIHRVEKCNLLPAIQNEEENEDVITTEENKTALQGKLFDERDNSWNTFVAKRVCLIYFSYLSHSMCVYRLMINKWIHNWSFEWFLSFDYIGCWTRYSLYYVLWLYWHW